MVNDISTQATEIINNQDDKMAMGMSLGSSSPNAEVIETDNTKYNNDWLDGSITGSADQKREDAEEDNTETDTTNYEQKEYEISKEIEDLQNFYENIDNMSDNELVNALTDEEFKKITTIDKKQWEWLKWNPGIYNNAKKYKELLNTIKNGVKQKVSQELGELRTIKDSYYDKWDRRTDEQKREDELREKQEERQDTAYQRAKEDLIKAGYNPAMLSGINYGGGGGGAGGSSKADEEERRRRRRKEEERQKKLQEQRQLMTMLSMLMGTIGYIGGSVIRSI
ncbi:MAG: hypothetical protein ACOYEB_12250 [Enterococcus lemanii]|jgi:hypothetical protein